MAWALSSGALSGIQVSAQASLMASPLPSKMQPLTVICGAALSTLAVNSTAQCQASCGKGPMVCDVVILLVMMVFALDTHRGRIATAQNDVEFIAEHLVVHCFFQTETRNQAFTRSDVGHTLEDRIKVEQGIVGEIHLRHQTLGIDIAEHRKVNMRRTPGLVMITPGIRARFDGHKTVTAIVVGEHLAEASEIRVQRCIVLVALVPVAAGGITLPDFQ